MNNTYRLIWNELANTWVAVAENAKSRGKRSAGALLLTAVASVAMAQTVSTQQLPTGGQILSGSGTISAQGAAMTVNQNTARMIANWSSFNIGANASVNFVQPSASAVALNRIQSQDPTQIMGRLTANGQVMLVNPAGVVFGRGSQVDVGSLVASSLAISDANFLNGNYRFAADGLTALGAVVNQGRITTANGGAVAFLAPVVKNEGQITTSKGSTLLAAAQDITVDFAGDGLIGYRVNAGAASALVENTGTVMADGGMAVLSAQSVDSITQGVVNNTGMVRAQRLENRDGRIVLEGHALVQTGTVMAPDINAKVDNLIASGTWDASAASNATVQGGRIAIQATGHVEQTDSGRINADGGAGQGGSVKLSAGQDVWVSGQISANGAQGGDVTVEAPSIVLAAAKVSATGQTANGGSIRIGGGYQGKDTDIVNAQTTRVVASELDVSVSQRGSAGQAIVWSESETVFGATVKASGGQQGGNGGLVEVSSHDKLTFAGQVNVTAPAGTNGRLLLDPKNIEIVTTVSPIQVLSLLDPTPIGSDYPSSDPTLTTSGLATELLNAGVGTNRIVFRSPYDSTTASKAGAVRLYNSQTGALMSTLTGSNANDFVGGLPIVSLGNGNFVVRSQAWTNSQTSPAVTKSSDVTTGLGAVTFVNGTTGLNGVVSNANSLVGSSAGDRVGFGGANAVTVKVLTNGNYVVSTPTWKNGTYTNAGAVTWGSGSLGVSGSISSANSFVGTSSNDLIGSGLIYSSTVGGTPSSTYMGSSSLIESYAASKGITALTNGNYVVTSPYWSGGMGAVTWFDGATGLPVGGTAGNAGSVSSSNSLIGSAATHFVGSRGVTPLSNGKYVVVSSDWDNGATTNVGAVTWGNGSNGSVVGAVSVNNSLIGRYAETYLGATKSDYTFKGITELTGGNFFVVASPDWRTGTAASDSNKGAITRLPTTSTSVQANFGYIDQTNSLVGSTGYVSISQGGDFVGRIGTMAGSISAYKSGVTPLALNDTFVVASPFWSGQVTYGGAVTWVGPGGLVGVVSTANSLYGTTTGEQAGSAGVYALANGNYVTSSAWSGGAGAVTWGDGATGVRGAIGPSNSLVGSSATDAVGATILPLNNSNYVVASPYWSNGSVSSVGAVTLVDGATGRASNGTLGNPGVVSSANSLVGSIANDNVGGTIYALPQSATTSNYIVLSPNWDRNFAVDPGTVGTGIAANAGAVTWGSGTVGVTGAVSIANSLIGSNANDKVGANSSASPFQALTNGNYVVSTPTWDNGAANSAGAATWGSGTAGVAGEISSANSLVGTVSNDQIGLQGVKALTTGNYVVLSPLRKVLTISGGAISWGNGVTGTVGAVTDQNSLLGLGGVAAESIGGSDALALSDGRALVFSNTGKSGVVNSAGRLDIISYLSPMPTLSDASAYATNSSLSQGVSASAINNAMSAGAAVTLQASNDIKVSSAITGTNSAGHLTLQAGRSILVNANITTGGANLTLKANEPLASGVVDAQRDAGAAEINMASGITLNAGNGNITLSLGAGTGLTESTSGNITLRTLTGNAISVVNAGATSGSSITSNNNITAASSLRLEADAGSVTVAASNIMAGAGSAILVARDDITLTSATTAPSGSTGGLTLLAGRSVLLNQSIDTKNGSLMIKANHYDGAAAVGANRLTGPAEITMGTLGTIATGTGVVNISIMDGTGLTTDTASGHISLKAITSGSLSVFNRGTTTGSAVNISGTLNASGAIDIAADYGNIALAGDLRTTNTSGSAIRLNAGAAASAGTTAGGDITVSGTVNGMPVIAMGTGGTARFYSGSAVNSTSLSVIATSGSRFSSDETTTLSPVLGAGKYAIYRQNTTPITLIILATTKDYGDLNPVLPNYSLTSGSFNSGDSISAIAWGSAATQYKAVGTYAYGSANLLSPTFACSAGGAACASDYTITYVNGLTINPRPITVTANPLSKFYGAADPALTYQISSGNLVNNETLSGTLSRTGGTHAGTFPINIGSLAATSNYALTYVPADLTINPAVLSVTLTNTGVTKTYDGSNAAPAGFSPAYSVSGAGGDAVTLSNAGFAYNSAHVLAANKVTVSGLSISSVTGSIGSLPGDYVLDVSSKDVAATITPKTLTVTASIGGALNKAYDGNAIATGARVSGTVTGAIAGDTLSVDGSGMTLAYGGIEGVSMIRTSGRSGLRFDQTLSGSVASDYSFTDPVIADVAGEIGRKPAQNSPIPPAPQSNAVNTSVDLNVEMKKEKVVAVADVIASAKVATEVPQMKIAATLSFGAADSLGMELVVSSNAASLTTVDAGPAKAGNAEDTEVKTNSVALFNQTGDKVAAGGALSIVEQGKNMRASVTTADTAQSLNVNLAGMRFVNVDFKLPSGAPNQLSVGVSADGMLVVKVPAAMKASSDDRSLALIGMATAKERLDVQPSSVKGVVIQVE